ncbi:MAG: lysylphosphatidylglycerol synthase domain-containing protein [Alphaproteobacteria bacterium]|nr:lysylphosphatidylglycerol synthase domain-containing protein [Alphaproteobacteria bacterium]
MQPTLSRTRKALPFLVSIGLAILILRQVDIREIGTSLGQFPIWSATAIILLVLCNILLVATRLSRLLALVDKSPKFATALRATVAGLVSSLVAFSLVGTILGRRAILRRTGVGVSTVALITTYERIMLAAIGGTLFLAGALYLIGPARISDIFDGIPIATIAAAVLLSFLTGLSLSRSKPEIALMKSVFSKVILGKIGEVGLIALLAQLVSIVVFALAVVSTEPSIDFMSSFAAATIVTFAASLPISVNGWGVREVTSVWVLGLLGVSAGDAVAISVAVGLLSTVSVLISGSILLFPQSDPSPAVPAADRSTGANVHAQIADRRLAPLLGISAAVLLYFQVRTTLSGAEITVNLADPFALLALTVAGVFLFLERRSAIRMPYSVAMWLIALTAMISIGFLIGADRFGVTPWALNNRLIGWLFILGYFLAGCALASLWGRRGLRRLSDFVIATAVVVTLANLAHQIAWRMFDAPLSLAAEFEGFAANRNAYAFQLLAALCCSFAYWRPGSAIPLRRFTWPILTGVLLFGLWQSSSKTGIGVGLMIIVLCSFLRIVSLRFLAQSLLAAVLLYAIVWALPGLFPADEVQAGTAVSRGIASFDTRGQLERLFSVSSAFDLWREAPIFGAGLGAFVHRAVSFDGGSLVIHATPVWILTEFGIVGFAIAAALPCYGLYHVWKYRPRWSDSRNALILTICFAFVLFSFAHDISYQRIFWLFLGASLGLAPSWRGGIARGASETIRIFHVITSLNRGGAETMLWGLMRARRQTIQPTVISLLPNGLLKREVEETGASVHDLGFSNARPSISGLWRLARLIRREKPHIVQGWMYHGDLIALAALYLSGRRHATALIWGIRCSDMDLSRYGWRLRAVISVCRWLSSLPDVVTANSHTGKRVHADLGYKPRRFEVLHNGIDIDRFSPRPDLRGSLREEFGIPANARVLIQVARVDPMKNYDGLISAVENVPGVWLVVVGRGTEAFAGRERVVALGQRSDVPSILQIADSVVSSSAYGEGFSNAVAEGMATGLVPIATDVGDSAYIVRDTGWLIPPSDPKALQTAIAEFRDLDDAALSARRALARSVICDHYSLSSAEASFHELYRDLMQNR